MKISVLSGKGGTGKTFVSTNLAYIIGDCIYADCDVEEPNGCLFINPNFVAVEEVSVNYPEFDVQKCVGCRECVEFCKFSALAYVKDEIMIFKELCHGCGGCIKLCKTETLKEGSRVVGNVKFGRLKSINTRSGQMNIGEVTGVPIIKHIMNNIPKHKTAVIDCPPGSSCLVMESIKDSDFCVLVTEPTIFGVHNLNMVYKLVNEFKIPCGVVINKWVDDNFIADKFCNDNNIPILLKIPFDKDIALEISNGYLISKNDNYKHLFENLYENILKEHSRK